MIKKLAIIGVVLMAGLLAMSCDGGGGNQAANVKVGALLALEGEYTVYGKSIQRGVDMAIEEINSTGGINGSDFSVIYADTKSTTEGTKTAFNTLLGQGVRIVIGPEITQLAATAIPLAKANKMIMISPSASSPMLRDISSDGYFFRVCVTDDSEAAQIAAELTRRGQMPFIKRPFTRALVLVRKDNDYTEGLWKALGREFGRLQYDYDIMYYHVENLQSEPGPDGYNEEMQEIIDKARDYQQTEKDPVRLGAVVVFGFADDVEAILRMFHENQLDVQVYTSSAVDTTTFFVDAAEVSQGIVFPRMFDPNNQEFPLIAEFVAKYKEKYQTDPDLYVAYGYDTAMLIAKTLMREGIVEDLEQPFNFRMEMNDVRYRGLTGRIDFQQAVNEVSKTPGLYKMNEYGSALALADYEKQLMTKRMRELNELAGRNR